MIYGLMILDWLGLALLLSALVVAWCRPRSHYWLKAALTFGAAIVLILNSVIHA